VEGNNSERIRKFCEAPERIGGSSGIASGQLKILRVADPYLGKVESGLGHNPFRVALRMLVGVGQLFGARRGARVGG
jgi:hypothetical protein